MKITKAINSDANRSTLDEASAHAAIKAAYAAINRKIGIRSSPDPGVTPTSTDYSP